MNEMRAKAIKLLEALAEPCDQSRKNNEHSWRTCRACLAGEEANTNAGKTLLRMLLTEMKKKASA